MGVRTKFKFKTPRYKTFLPDQEKKVAKKGVFTRKQLNGRNWTPYVATQVCKGGVIEFSVAWMTDIK